MSGHRTQPVVVAAAARERASLLEVPWLLATAVVRMMARQLDDRRVRKLTSGSHLR